MNTRYALTMEGITKIMIEHPQPLNVFDHHAIPEKKNLFGKITQKGRPLFFSVDHYGILNGHFSSLSAIVEASEKLYVENKIIIMIKPRIFIFYSLHTQECIYFDSYDAALTVVEDLIKRHSLNIELIKN